MHIVSLFDEKAVSRDLKTGFGLSMLIDNRVLFDTGSDGEVLVHNLRALKVNTAHIEAVVLSHMHWDHIDGFEQVLAVLPPVHVYVCPGFPEHIKRMAEERDCAVITSYFPGKIVDRIFTTGELSGKYNGMLMPEQAVFVEYAENRIALFCGCAHFGIGASIGAIRRRIEIYFSRIVAVDVVGGGLHLSHESDEEIAAVARRLCDAGVRRVAPIHCSGDKGRALLSAAEGLAFDDLNVGGVLKIEE